MTLTPRQWEVLRVLATGVSHEQAAALLCCAKKTIDSQVADIFDALDLDNRNIISACLKTGILVPGDRDSKG